MDRSLEPDDIERFLRLLEEYVVTSVFGEVRIGDLKKQLGRAVHLPTEVCSS